MDPANSLNWSLDAFLDTYNSIKTQGTVSSANAQALQQDLKSILVVPGKNEKSRAALAAGENGKPVSFHNGQEYTLNSLFISMASTLASEISLDELSAAELLQDASSTNFAHGSNAVDAGILNFYQRYSFILNILGFVISKKQLETIYSGNIAEILPQILKSFKQIYSLASYQNDLIDKQTATADVNSLSFVNKITFTKEQLFELHDLLAQILYSLIDNYIEEFGTYNTYKQITEHINQSVTDNADSLLLHYLPALMRIITGLSDLKDDEVHQFHKNFTAALTADYAKVNQNDQIDTSRSSIRPHESLLQLVFYISFIPWCKQLPARTEQYDFENHILKYAEWLINYGTMEQLLCYCAESANSATEATFDRSKLFDFRPLLQRSFPRLKPSIFVYSRNEELLHAVKTRPELTNVSKLCDYSPLQLSTQMKDLLLAPFFHSFFYNFVNHAAIILTSLRDNEEDFLLSSINRKQSEFDSFNTPSDRYESGRNAGENGAKSFNSIDTKQDYGIDLDELATRAELERFYLAFAYTYSNRANICQAFWSHDNSNIAGFINWGLANNTSPLITATFCLLLGSSTYGGSSDKVWEILLNSGLSRKKDYSQISIDSIISSLSYYADALEENVIQDLRDQGKLNQEKHESLFSNGKSTIEAKPVPIQLSEDSVVFIAGFMMLISMVVENLSSNLLKNAAFSHFSPVIRSFLKLDNLITATNATPESQKSISICFNDENRTEIINLVLNLLTKFADGADLRLKGKIWIIIDQWICHSLTETDSAGPAAIENGRSLNLSLAGSSIAKSDTQKVKAFDRSLGMKKGFETNLTTISEVLNFVKLLAKLLDNSSGPDNKAWSIPFPADLGQTHRSKKQTGVWPYLEYLITEVFGNTAKLKNTDIKFDIQGLILSVIVSSLKEVDWNLIDKTAQDVLPDLAQFQDRFAEASVSSGELTVLSLQNFARLHHSFAIINYMFDSNASNALFQLINTGSEELNQIEDFDSIISLALEALNLLLISQSRFIDRLAILKNFDSAQIPQGQPMGYGTSMSLMLSSPQLEYNNMYYPDSIGTKGLKSYYDMLLFHISSVAHIALYVGNSSESLASLSLEILSLISQSQEFVPRPQKALLQHNRLLTIFESIDDSEKIKFGFLQQMENTTSSLETKYNVLRYLLENLPSTNEISVAHFLLGFEIKAGKLHLVMSDHSNFLLRSLLSILIETLPFISQTGYEKVYQNQIACGPVTSCALIMEIIVRLCQNHNSSKLTLDFLRQYELFATLVNAQPKIDDMTIWHTERFDGNVEQSSVNRFVEDEECGASFYQLVKFRTLVLKYLSLELHNTSSSTQAEAYARILLDGTEFLDGTAKVLNFLDVLNYRFHRTGEYDFSAFTKHYHLQPLAHAFDGMTHKDGEKSFMSDLMNLKCRIANNVLPDNETKDEFRDNARIEANEIYTLLQKVLYVRKMKASHFETLHAWVQIVQVLTSQKTLAIDSFIPQVFQAILPKINDYYNYDLSFAEEMISLCLFLFDLLEEHSEKLKPTKEVERENTNQTFALFKTCINGLLCSSTSPQLRSNLYLLMNKNIQRGIKNKDVLQEATAILRSADSKFIDVVCNDTIYSEGVSRISSLIFLETLVHLADTGSLNSVHAAFTKGSFLSLLVRSLKRADDALVVCTESTGHKDSGINLETLFYELTALKSALNVLIRLGQTKSGALLLVQNEMFPTLQKLKFMSADAELGLSFLVQNYENGGDSQTAIKLALDVPLTLREKEINRQEALSTFSLCEVLTPIFQLVATVLLSLGPSYRPGLAQAENLMKRSHSIVLGVMKRDSLMDNGRIAPPISESEKEMQIGLKKLVELFTLISTVISGTGSG